MTDEEALRFYQTKRVHQESLRDDMASQGLFNFVALHQHEIDAIDVAIDAIKGRMEYRPQEESANGRAKTGEIYLGSEVIEKFQVVIDDESCN
jgi:hypothetical protein